MLTVCIVPGGISGPKDPFIYFLLLRKAWCSLLHLRLSYKNTSWWEGPFLILRCNVFIHDQPDSGPWPKSAQILATGHIKHSCKPVLLKVSFLVCKHSTTLIAINHMGVSVTRLGFCFVILLPDLTTWVDLTYIMLNKIVTHKNTQTDNQFM